MNRTCANCDWNISEDEIVECTSPAEICNTYNNHWKPMENKMSEKIQMTEEQAYELSQCFRSTWEEDLKRLKEKGYIKKSDLEIAKENYETKNSNKNDALNYIDELEKEVERFKK